MITKKQLQQLARQKNIQTVGLEKKDVIRALQRAEKNLDCFGTDRISVCQEEACLWRKDCVAIGQSTKHGATSDGFFRNVKKGSVRTLSVVSHLFLSGKM